MEKPEIPFSGGKNLKVYFLPVTMLSPKGKTS